MTGKELYAHLRSGLGGWFRREGFRSARQPLGWQRPRDDGDVLLVWFQCDKWGWDQYSGSGFYVNFQIGPTAAHWDGRMERLPYFLSAGDLEEVRALQNLMIARLAPPPASHVELLRREWTRLFPAAAADMLETYLSAFKLVTEPYRSNWDFTLRYYDQADVDRWVEFLGRACPRIVGELASGFPARR